MKKSRIMIGGVLLVGLVVASIFILKQPKYIEGDIDRDGTVGVRDLSILLKHYGETSHQD